MKRSVRPYAASVLIMSACLVAIAEEAQQHEEEVDEVEIKGQRAENGAAANGYAVFNGGSFAHLAQLLGIPCGQTGKDDDADHADDEIHRRTLQEEIHDAGEDNAPQTHHEETSHAGQIAFGDHAEHAHSAEHACRHHEGPGHGSPAVGQRTGESQKPMRAA